MISSQPERPERPRAEETEAAIPEGPSPAEELTRAAAAMGRDDRESGYIHLARVWRECGDSPVGRRALLVGAAAELDARSPERDLDLAAELASVYLESVGEREWGVPLAESLYLAALELGAAPPDSVGRGETAPPPGPGDEAADSLASGESAREAFHEVVRAGAPAVADDENGRAAKDKDEDAGRAEPGARDRCSGVPAGFVSADDSAKMRKSYSPASEETPEARLGTAPEPPAEALVTLPVLPVRPVPERIATLERRIEELLQELERIRQTLQP